MSPCFYRPEIPRPLLASGLVFPALVISLCATGVGRRYGLEAGELRVTLKPEQTADVPRFDKNGAMAAVVLADHAVLAGNGLRDEFGLEGQGVLGYEVAPAAQHRLVLSDPRGCRVTVDTSLVRISLWSDQAALSPEMFSCFHVEPSVTVERMRSYRFEWVAAEGAP